MDIGGGCSFVLRWAAREAWWPGSFVSHAGADLALARKVHGWLAEAGHDVFLDRHPQDGVVVGERWEQRLYERLRWADAVVCVVTSTYADPVQARTALIEALRQVDLGWPSDRSPFPGLRPFEADQHRVFFGRAEEIRQLSELLRSPVERAEGAALLVVGPSGCGKSSLVRAGLAPVLADELLVADPAGPQQRLLIVVDQFEELLTQAPPAARARFAGLLRPALSGPVRVVATLRPEFLDQLLVDPALAALPTRTYTLRPLRQEALRAVIEKPAQLAGIEIDDGLVERLVADTDTGEALPLLAFTLAQLADGIPRGGRLSHARYEQLGGV